MTHANLVAKAYETILAIWSDQSIDYDVTRESLLELEDLILACIRNIEAHA